MIKVRKSYSVAMKLDVLDWHKTNGTNMHKTSKHFSIDRKTLREWISKENVLRGNCFGASKDKKKLGSGRKPLSDVLDDELFEFFESELRNGRAVSNKLLSEKACTIALSLGLLDFKASDRYVSNWKRRFDISVRKGIKARQKAEKEMQERIDLSKLSSVDLMKQLEQLLYDDDENDKDVGELSDNYRECGGHSENDKDCVGHSENDNNCGGLSDIDKDCDRLSNDDKLSSH